MHVADVVHMQPYTKPLLAALPLPGTSKPLPLRLTQQRACLSFWLAAFASQGELRRLIDLAAACSISKIIGFLPQIASKKQGLGDLWQSWMLPWAFGTALHLNAFGWKATAAVKPCSSMPVGCD